MVVSPTKQTNEWIILLRIDSSKKNGNLILEKRGEKEARTIELKHISFLTEEESKVHAAFAKISFLGHPFRIDTESLQNAIQQYLNKHSQEWIELQESLQHIGIQPLHSKYVTISTLNQARDLFSKDKPKQAPALKHLMHAHEQELLFTLSWGVKKIIPVCGERNKNFVFSVDPKTHVVSLSIGPTQLEELALGRHQKASSPQATVRANIIESKHSPHLPSLWTMKMLPRASEEEVTLEFETKNVEGQSKRIRLHHIALVTAAAAASAHAAAASSVSGMPHTYSTNDADISRIDKRSLEQAAMDVASRRPKTVPYLIKALTHFHLISDLQIPVLQQSHQISPFDLAKAPSSVHLEEKKGAFFLVVGEYSIRLWTIDKFSELCLHDRKNSLFCGNVSVKIGNKSFKVSCREIAETIQKASSGSRSEAKNDLEQVVEKNLGISKNPAAPPNFPEANPVLEKILHRSGLTRKDAKKVIQYIYENYSVLMDAVSWASLSNQCIRVKKSEELPCSFTLRVIDRNVRIEFATCHLGQGAFSTVRRVVLYCNTSSGTPCIKAIACRRARTQKDSNSLLGAEEQLYRQQCLSNGFVIANILGNTVPYISHEEFLVIPAQGGFKEKIYCEEGVDTLDGVLSSSTGMLSADQYDYLYAVMLCILEALHIMHRIRHFHFDIKPKNILIMHDASPRLIDFGLTKCIHAEDLLSGSTPRATPGYKEPQCYDETIPIDIMAGAAIDTFSLGATILELFCPQILPNRRFLQCQVSGTHNKDNKTLFAETCGDILDYQAALLSATLASPPDQATLYKTIANMISISREDRPSLEDVFNIALTHAPSGAKNNFMEFENR